MTCDVTFSALGRPAGYRWKCWTCDTASRFYDREQDARASATRHRSDPSQTSANVDALPADRAATPTAPSGELANGSTCGFCGEPTDTWPSKDCEEPQEHTPAVYDCDCGDVVTIAEAVANPKRHRRCHLIGASE